MGKNSLKGFYLCYIFAAILSLLYFNLHFGPKLPCCLPFSSSYVHPITAGLVECSLIEVPWGHQQSLAQYRRERLVLVVTGDSVAHAEADTAMLC